MKAKYFTGAALFALAVSLSPVVAGAQQLNVDHSGVAISGYDPVAYFTAQSAVQGSPEITATYEGATYRFSTKANRGRGLGTYGMKLLGETVLGGVVGFTSNWTEGTHFFIELPGDD